MTLATSFQRGAELRPQHLCHSSPSSPYKPSLPLALYDLTIKMSIEVINTISPTTGETVITRNGVSSADLDLLPKVATEAFQSFRKTTLKQRQEIVKKFLKGLADREAELAEELTVQMGRPIAFTGKEITTAVKRGEYLLKISGDALQDTDGEAEKGFKRFIRKVPVGPVLVLFAWNVSLRMCLCQ